MSPLKRPGLYEFGKYGVVGILNTCIDFGVLNALIFATGIWSGAFYSVFKGISFLAAAANSFFWNRRWTFASVRDGRLIVESLKFIVVAGIGWVMNVVAASFVVNVLDRPQAISPHLWANIGALAGTILSLIWNFIGYKFFVFKKSSLA